MKPNISVFVSILVATCVGGSLGGHFVVVHSPKSVRFVETDKHLAVAKVADVILATFGRQTENTFKWNGLLQGNFFQRPKANVLFSINGVHSTTELNLTSQLAYRTTENGHHMDADSIVSGLKCYIKDERPLLFADMSVDPSYQLQTITDDSDLNIMLPLPSPHKRSLLAQELTAIDYIVMQISKNFAALQRSSPDFFHFRLDGLETVREKYGVDSAQMREALSLVGETISKATLELRKLYEDNLVVEVLTYSPAGLRTKMSAGRKGRRLLQQTTAISYIEEQNSLNLAPEFTWMYPEMFNITLWFMVVFVLIIFGVAWCIWFTDPGRDGLIYRMTTTHLKAA